jgi:carbamoyltransferase
MAISCGLKLTHDGAVALMDEDKLIACHEAEKHGNAPRYSEIGSLKFVFDILSAEYIRPEEIDRVVIDGWRSEVLPLRRRTVGGSVVDIDVAPYGHDRNTALMEPLTFEGCLGPRLPRTYSSCVHIAGHLASSYCTSPFAASREDSYVVVWDGGTVPRLFHVRYGDPEPQFVAPLGTLFGSIYSIFPLYFEPFRVPDAQLAARQVTDAEIGVAGKAMAFAGLGAVVPELVAIIDRLISEAPDGGTWDYSFEMTERFRALAPDATPADAIASFDWALGTAFISNLVKAVEARSKRPVNVCLAGGCGLNLRWNTRLRELPVVREVWVPPFPNDSGSALGAVLAERFSREGAFALDWHAYLGPELRREAAVVSGWTRRDIDPEGLGALLHATGEPVVVLTGRAELGPRALGNRSILCAPHAGATAVLNAMKEREWYRPVAPICLEQEAAEVFAPGCADPYMLFNHRARPGWAARIPATIHVDGTSRLQTVNDRQNPVVARILRGYFAVSGIPVLCNTSANLAGCGFFPDVESALKWGRTRYVWSDGILYEQAVDATSPDAAVDGVGRSWGARAD